ncbi:MAG TPA: DUF6799 domain-containing protein [Segetibacter sp.]|jgi:hypothetical protein
MKKFLLFAGLSLTTLLSIGQKGKDYITMKPDGKVYWIRSGQTIRMMINVPLKSGEVVNSKGNIIAKDGTVRQLAKGDKVMMDGSIMKKGKK